MTDQPTTWATVAEGVARISWLPGEPVDVVRREVAEALITHARVEALVDPADEGGQRTATWSGMRREGVMRGVTVDGTPVDRIVYARLATDVPTSEPEGFRALLNSFLPRKRAIGQMLVRDREGRVLLCQLTYKQDWDLPGGVVEVGESPQTAVEREVEEELGLRISTGSLLLTDWLPPWSGWDDALCLVFDGGVHDASLTDRIVKQVREIRSAEFRTLEEADQLCADFTARRVRAAMANLGGGPAYTESGRG
ncbi:NUDIX domain-containing protein [Nocardioides sp. zg-579]|uniref:NUDIX domain-containing protein n=1 Tax=Nocardioides marmotae TaxID=2663857 RepID=A0A6I3JB55_9ACTN|nr:NUDIX hydrolase [Nocardioides marmotae]MCR6031701.1 NUDIX domain-containing protein [Gordonia jinghuaiqii]MTB95340.1 NUDIX domain-containing protein [Nocardioides marmotae]QKE02200.1 NUDIX hydrolase [Nocardioides marmotae]